MEKVELEVPGRGVDWAWWVFLAWGFVCAACWSDEVGAPPWAFRAALAAGPLVAVVVGWSLITRRVVVASREGLRITRRPFSGRDRLVPREDLAALVICQWDEADTLLDERGLIRLEEPTSQWVISVRTRSGRELGLTPGYEYGDQAEQLASELKQALGGDLEVEHRQITELPPHAWIG